MWRAVQLSYVQCSVPFQSHISHVLQAYNDSACGVQYSSYVQVPFCDVTEPAVWPAVLQVRLAGSWRAGWLEGVLAWASWS